MQQLHLRPLCHPRHEAVPSAVRPKPGGPQEAAAIRVACIRRSFTRWCGSIRCRDARCCSSIHSSRSPSTAWRRRESRALLDTLFHQALHPGISVPAHWEPHTIAMWDNRSTQHYAVHDYYPAAPLYGARHHPRRRGHRRRTRRSGDRAPRQIRGAEERRRPRRPQAALRGGEPRINGRHPGSSCSRACFLHPGCLLTTSGSAWACSFRNSRWPSPFIVVRSMRAWQVTGT